jgi:iduronate 2-sulfatase
VDRIDHSKLEGVELYDHKEDPQENINIANRPTNQALVEQLTTQWQKGWKAARPAAK